MRSIRRTNARDKAFNKKKSHSSLASLPSTNSKNNYTNNKTQSTKYKRNSTIKSIQRTPKKANKYSKYEEKETEAYDSTDSLDQLLDNSFFPNKKKMQSNHLNSPKNKTPRKNIGSTAGKKRSKALALMASNMKQRHNNRDRKKEYKTICNQLKHTTPAIKNKTHSNYTSLRKSRKIITPKRNCINENKSYIDIVNGTPKLSSDKLKCLDTPYTPTPVKLIKNLNVKTPQTMNKNMDDNEKKIKRKLSLRYDDNILKSWKDIEYSSNKKSVNGKSWKDIDYRGDKNNNNNNNNIDDLSEFERLQLCTRKLQLPIKYQILLQKFNALESTLALLMRKNSFFVHLQSAQRSVQQITKKKLFKSEFQQILNIIPEFYHVQWTPYINKTNAGGEKKKVLRLTVTAIDCLYDDLGQNDNDNDNDNDNEINKGKKDKKSNDIGIKFLKVSKLKERECIFRVKLYEYIRDCHLQFLEDNILVEFDPFITGKWHTRFDLENVKEINMELLPKRPVKNVNEMEKMINKQTEQLAEIVEKEKEKVKKEKENDEIPKHLRGLSPTFIAKIRAKTKNREINMGKLRTKKKNNKFDEEKYRLRELPYLVNLVRGIYVSLKKGAMSCNDLISFIKKRHKNQFLMNEEIWKQLQMLNELKSKFFIIKQGPIVKVARLSKKVDVKQVFDEINEKIKS